MSASSSDDAGPAPDERPPLTDEERRRIAAVFGDVLPDQTSDDREDAGEAPTGSAGRDAEILRDVPPHHN